VVPNYKFWKHQHTQDGNWEYFNFGKKIPKYALIWVLINDDYPFIMLIILHYQSVVGS
jgi:hypothetical protein